MTWLRRLGALGFVAAVTSASCADDGEATFGREGVPAGEEGGDFGDGDSDGDSPSDGDHSADAGASVPLLPPEQEEILSFDAPRAGKTSVYIPNPLTSRIAVVNAETFAIETIAAGSSPTYAATVPGQDVALVINVGSQDASLLRTLDGHTQAKRLALGHAANAIAISPNGRHAVIYLDASLGGNQASSFQDVTVVDLSPEHETSRGVSVGFRPRGVRFSADGGRAFVITEDGISVVDLAAAVEGPTIATLVSVGDSLSSALSLDVQITPDGRYAVARREGSPEIRRVDLESGDIRELSLRSLQQPAPVSAPLPDGGVDQDAGVVTIEQIDQGVVDGKLTPGSLDLSDMDLAPDGSFLLAVERRRGALIRIPVPGDFEDPTLVKISEVNEQLVGSVSIAKTGALAVLYTTVNDVEGIVLVDPAGELPARGVRLRKAVRAVAFSDNGLRAVVLHKAVAQSGASDPDEQRIDASEGYSLIDTTNGFAKLQLTSARVRQADVLVLDGPGKLFALLRNDATGVRSLDMADLNSFQVENLPLARPPSSIGLLPGLARIFIGQENPGGMITFVNGDTGEVARAVSGFELASRIRQ